MILLFDIGNTNTHVGLANDRRVTRQANLPTALWQQGRAVARVRKFVGRAEVAAVAVCSVVPRVTPLLRQAVQRIWGLRPFELSARTLSGLGIDYRRPESIGADRLANAVAARQRFGAPVVVVDFGTAVTFDVVNCAGNYIGGVIAPGLASMTDYLHEKTALLPRIRIREVKSPIGRSTEEAMRVGAVHGYRGLIHAVLIELKQALHAPRVPVVATGGYARLIAARLPEIMAVEPNLTLEGLRWVWQARRAKG
jgi:type III pantothenate kinase